MNATEKRQLVKRLRKGREKARRERPQRLERLEQRMDELEQRRREATTPEARAAIVRELQPLGRQRTALKWTTEEVNR